MNLIDTVKNHKITAIWVLSILGSIVDALR